jgi:hypothetical protein
MKGAFDSRALTGLRMTVRGSAGRNLRVDLESPAQTATNSGIRVGWDVTVTPTTKTVQLAFANAFVPSWAIEEGKDPKDDMSAIRAAITGIAFHPYCNNRNTQGFIPTGETDPGWVEIDDLQFY